MLQLGNDRPRDGEMRELLLTLLVCSGLFATSCTAKTEKFNVDSFDCSNQSKLICAGDASSEGGILKLTKGSISLNGLQNVSAETGSSGSAFYPGHVRLKHNGTHEAYSFESSFTFKITNQTISKSPSLTGDGFMFVIISNRSSVGMPRSGGRGLGVYDSDTGLPGSKGRLFCLEFDTYRNEYDVSANHVGVDTQSVVSEISTDLYPQGIQLANGEMQVVWINYYAAPDRRSNGILEVRINGTVNGTKPENALLRYSVNLADLVDDNMWIGFAASTGTYAELHAIHNWKFEVDLNSFKDTRPLAPGPVLGGHPEIPQSPVATPIPLGVVPSPPKPTGTSSSRHQDLIIGVSVAAGCTVLIALGILLLRWRILRNKADELKDFELGMEHVPRRFKYKDLKMATNGFGDRSKLGEGGFGRVYCGVLPNTGTKVAVKKVNNESKQGGREFIAEISIISRLRHRNLVKLLGWCADGGRFLLVYELMPRRSLDQALYNYATVAVGDSPEFDEAGVPRRQVLSWARRFSIVTGVAAALHYLHEGWEQRVIHRDVKASNVMLDDQFNAKLGDFGLARLVEHHKKPQTTQLAGTFGYIAPEAAVTGKYTDKTDVYSFGALTLEIACGRRPLQRDAGAQESLLVDWVWTCHNKGNILGAADANLAKEFDVSQMEMTLSLGLLCSNPDPAARPSMRQVVQILAGDLNLPTVPNCKPVAVWQYKYPYPAMTFNNHAIVHPPLANSIAPKS